MATNDPPSFPYGEQNPYAPPRSDVELEPVFTGITPMPFTLGEVLTRTWEIYRDRMGICIGVVVAWLVMYVVAECLFIFPAQLARNETAMALMLVGLPVLFLFMLWVSTGMFKVLLDIARGRDTGVGGLFSGGRYLVRMILATVLFTLIIMGAVLICVIPGALISAVLGTNSIGGSIAMFIAVITGYVVAFILSFRISPATLMIIDRDAGVIESLRRSYEITRGKVGMIFVIYLLISVINMAGALACGVGLIFTMPYAMLMIVVTYLALTGQPTADPNAKGEPLAELEPL